MAYISTTERNAMPAWQFAGPGRTYPIRNQGDLDAAVHRLGQSKNSSVTKAGIKRIAARLKLKLPAAWTSTTAMSELSFGDVTDLLRSALRDAVGYDPQTYQNDVCIMDVYSDSVIYCLYSGMDECYKASYMVEADGSVTLGTPVQVKEVTTYETVQMSAFSLDESTPREDGEWVVYPEAVIFKAGEYPDRELTVTQEDLEAMVDHWSGPVRGDLEHIFDRHPSADLGTLAVLEPLMPVLRRIWVGEDGETLRGEVAVQRWMDAMLPGKGISAVVPVNDPTVISRFTLTTRPRVQGAALMSAYTKFTKGKVEMPEKNKTLTKIRELLGMDPEDGDDEDEGSDTTDPVPVQALMSRIEELEAERVSDRLTHLIEAKKIPPSAVPFFSNLYRRLRSDDVANPQAATFADADGKEVTVGSRVALLDAFVNSLPATTVAEIQTAGEIIPGAFSVPMSDSLSEVERKAIRSNVEQYVSKGGIK